MTPRHVTHPSLLTLTHADYSQSYSENRAGAGGSAADTGSDRQLWLDWERNPANWCASCAREICVLGLVCVWECIFQYFCVPVCVCACACARVCVCVCVVCCVTTVSPLPQCTSVSSNNHAIVFHCVFTVSWLTLSSHHHEYHGSPCHHRVTAHCVDHGAITVSCSSWVHGSPCHDCIKLSTRSMAGWPRTTPWGKNASWSSRLDRPAWRGRPFSVTTVPRHALVLLQRM